MKFQKNVYLCRSKTKRRENKSAGNLAEAKAQMAESVDALVSNTSGAIHPGSIPGLGTELETLIFRVSNFFFISS